MSQGTISPSGRPYVSTLSKLSFEFNFWAIVLLGVTVVFNCKAAELSGKTVEVFNTGGIGLRAWTSICTGTYVNKPDATKGVVVSSSAELCSGYQRWKIKWPNDTTERWSAEDWLRVIPPDLTISGAVTISPSSPVVGTEITVSCTIENVGLGNAIPSGTKILLLRVSPFEIVSTQDFIETEKVAVGSSIPFSYKIPLPANLSLGDYQISVEVDSLNSIDQIVFDNDIKKSASFKVSPSHFTVTATAGAGGTVLPSGSQSISANGTVSFTASPNSTNNVDKWLVNDVVKQTGGTQFTLNPVTENATVSVTFKLKTYNLTVNADNADITITPLLSEYPHGGRVTVRANPHPGRIFSQWTGTIQSVENSITFLILENTSLTALLKSISSSTIIRTANSTPATSFDIKYPTSDGYLYVLYCSTDQKYWRPLTVKTGQNQTDALHQISTTSGVQGYYRIRQFSSYFMAPFLRFPLLGGNSMSSRISSILDHHGTASYQKDGAILTYKGQLATVDAFGYGYRTQQSTLLERIDGAQGSPNYYGLFRLAAYGRNSAGNDFDLPFNYQEHEPVTPGQKGLLFYDSHRGYDYPANKGIAILAAATGNLIPGLCGGDDNQIVIRHLNGYRTLYLHCDSWTEAIQTAVNNRDETYTIQAGQTIAYVGARGAGPDANHLHFEVHRYSGEDSDYVLADPYGFYAEDDSIIDPPLWISGQ